MSGTIVETFGCRLNAFESEVIKGAAEKAGLQNAIIFNTCAVTAEATRQARQAIRKAHRDNPSAQIFVTGCGAQTDTKSFADMPEVARVLGNEEKLHSASYVPLSNRPRVDVGDIMQIKEAKPPLIDRLSHRTRAFIQVQNGCDHRCTFCIIPFGRGNSRSVAIEDVVIQVKRLVDAGHAELVLSGVDLTSWGADLDGSPKLGKLVSTVLAQVPDLKRLRLSSIDSIEADDELIAVIAGESRIMPHLHLSLQSGDNMILKRMKRRHAREDSVEFCAGLRKLRPDMVFGADLIAGFPTETDEMFENSLKLIDDCGLTFLHVFPYSPRPGTPAAKMPEVAGDVVKRRAGLLRAKGATRLERFLTAQVNNEFEILVETPHIGRTPHFAVVKFAKPQVPGTLIGAKISGMQGQDLLVDM